MFQIILKSETEREKVSRALSEKLINTVPHYVPLHSSPKGLLVGRSDPAGLPVTDWVSNSLLRLPLYPELGTKQERVIDAVQFATR